MKYFWHVHHETLVESSENIEGRIEYIRENKPSDEIETRLRLIKEVKGQLPIAWRDAEKAWQDAEKAWLDAYDVCRDVYNAWQAANKDEIEALHKLECLNCPWNGETIFPANS
ncbi:MAG: hypothetical protein NUV76_12105 [Candidatus Kuenenia sp.]|nr:hypothetical protein [Candidatus Kuenenia sp.]